MRRGIAIAFGTIGIAASSGAVESDGVQFFREEVKPILEQNCFKCHGGLDEKGTPKVRGGLQLISRRGLLQGGDHGAVFDEAEPDRSLLLRAVSYEDENLQMPPRGKLADSDREKLRRWLSMGAPWTPEDAERLVEVHDPLAGVTVVNEKTRSHWSYRPMVRVEPPVSSDPEWNLNPVDAFIRAKLDEQGLVPVGEAPRAVLLRRLSYDLTGLPPTLAEIRDFEADGSPDAWKRQVDRLLGSSAYGEKWGRHWLDLVRYAESNGFERDNDKPYVWRYRDYVIHSFNEDKPYDRFVAEQIAGDELPDKTVDSQVATGMLRLMAWDDDPADPVQNYHDVLDDNVRTVTEGFLGFTAGCARCHDHKGDPIPQTDYYRFAAFFRGIEPMGRGGRQTKVIETPELVEARDLQLESLSMEEEGIRRQMDAIEETAFESVSRTRSDIAERVTKLTPMSRWLITDGRLRPTIWHYTEEYPGDQWSRVGFRAEQEGWRQGPAGFGTAAPGVQARTVWTGPEIWLQTTFGLESLPKSLLLHLYHDNAIEIYLNGQPVLHREGWSTEYAKIPAPAAFMAALQTGRNVLAVHVSQDFGGQFFDLGIEIDAITRSDIVLNPEFGSVGAAEREAYRLASERMEEIRELRSSAGVEAMVITERKEIPPTHVMIRGNAHSEGEVVVPGYPAIWGGEDASIPPESGDASSSGRRLALAEWLTRPDNPRTARVMVNRIWQHHFGRGICPTPNDFGFLGMPATHPELLDWLATEFVARGWSMKAMHRLILNSKAYRMASSSKPANAAVDPDNNLFWRFNPRRLAAEELRDSILTVTGELNPEMGGPSVFVPMPEEVLATSSTKEGKWGFSPPDQANRRSIYVKIKRSLLPPMLTDFDFAEVDNPCPVRFTTTVPTQALAMLNSEFIHDKAAALAARLQAECPDDLHAQVVRAFELVLTREPEEIEIIRALTLIHTLKAEGQLTPGDALQRFALAMFNLNEFIYLD
ncbi:PSD1 and planctomycete cytochrome C domain-containing protein [Luteolibacter marinus]|uniref:PSD1 and planctomycete cytochrome C domain-containing protein n=1 Tax=Luteolibacter marinus TaxID=2776705 RepID=UPI0018663905|nr:PSD1 and planctomycete cytochrome C domain-containing protein [Luteolibacter marinus]